MIAQRPGAGGFVDDGTAVELVVSRGPPKVKIPDVAGRSEADAAAALEAAGFVVETDRRNDENVPFDAVIGSEPEGGASAVSESIVRLVVSDGPAPVVVEDVGGKTYDEAAQILAASRFTAVRGADEFSSTVPAGAVIRTDPPAGTSAPRDSEVAIIVSKGPELVEVPNLVSNTLEVAQARLQALGFEVDTVSYLPGRTVRATNPAAGSMVGRGTKVTLTF